MHWRAWLSPVSTRQWSGLSGWTAYRISSILNTMYCPDYIDCFNVVLINIKFGFRATEKNGWTCNFTSGMSMVPLTSRFMTAYVNGVTTDGIRSILPMTHLGGTLVLFDGEFNSSDVRETVYWSLRLWAVHAKRNVVYEGIGFCSHVHCEWVELCEGWLSRWCSLSIEHLFRAKWIDDRNQTHLRLEYQLSFPMWCVGGRSSPTFTDG